jgi:hypothetical protein
MVSLPPAPDHARGRAPVPVIDITPRLLNTTRLSPPTPAPHPPFLAYPILPPRLIIPPPQNVTIPHRVRNRDGTSPTGS